MTYVGRQTDTDTICVCHLYCTTNALCISACTRKLRGTWSTVAHQFLKSLAVDTYAQPVDNTLLCHRVTGWTRSGAFGPFRSLALFRETLYRIVSMIQHWVLAILRNYLKWNYICELLNSLTAAEMFRDSALYKFTIDIDSWHWQNYHDNDA